MHTNKNNILVRFQVKIVKERSQFVRFKLKQKTSENRIFQLHSDANEHIDSVAYELMLNTRLKADE